MATKIHHIQRPEGLDNLVDAVDLIKNWKTKGEPYVNQINDAIAEFNKRIEAVGKIDEIDALRATAESSLTAASNKLADAMSEAERIISDAKEKAEREVAEAHDLHAFAEGRKEEAEKEVAGIRAELARRERDVTERENAVANRASALAREETQLNSERAAFDEQAKRLRAALP